MPCEEGEHHSLLPVSLSPTLSSPLVKNVREERDAPEQIMLGAMDYQYCILLALRGYLEEWVEMGDGHLAEFLFCGDGQDPM
eukprot:11426899-Ditylum_brightwellii.AAC.1